MGEYGRAMKLLLLPTLVLAAAAAHAQTAPVVPASKAGEVGKLSLGYADSGAFDGFRLGVSAGLVNDLFLQASFADISGPTVGTVDQDFRAYSFGAGVRLPFGAGKAALSAHLGSLDSDTDELNGDQFQLRAAEHIAKAEQVKDVLEVREAGIESARTRCLMAKAVIGGPLLRIGKDRVCLGTFLELFFGVRVVRIFVGVELNRHRAVCPFDLNLCGGPGNAQNLVIISLAHRMIISTKRPTRT